MRSLNFGIKLRIIALCGVLVFLLTAVSIAHADLIAQVTFTGDFTLNHLYDFNDPGAQPFGTFSDQTVIGSNGLFSPFIHVGQIINGQPLWTENTLPLFTIGGFSLLTNSVSITGPDSGRLVVGFTDLDGNGYQFDPNHSLWTFIAPPYDISNFHHDITGPITLQFRVFDDNFQVPDSGGTFTLMASGLLGLFFYARRVHP